jgi:hypothetical protein
VRILILLLINVCKLITIAIDLDLLILGIVFYVRDSVKIRPEKRFHPSQFWILQQGVQGPCKQKARRRKTFARSNKPTPPSGDHVEEVLITSANCCCCLPTSNEAVNIVQASKASTGYKFSINLSTFF